MIHESNADKERELAHIKVDNHVHPSHVRASINTMVFCIKCGARMSIAGTIRRMGQQCDCRPPTKQHKAQLNRMLKGTHPMHEWPDGTATHKPIRLDDYE